MKRILLLLSLLILVSLACDISVAVGPTSNPAPLPTNTTVPPTPVPPATATALEPLFLGEEVTVSPLTIALLPELAGGIHGIQVPRAQGDNVASWDVTPGHTELILESYILQGKSHEPKIYVYPAQAYAEMFPAAFESMHRLNNIIANSSAPISPEQLPAVPFFNAQQAFASKIQPISFQNGQGVRFLTEYAQYPVSANNQDLFYQFQGLTSDGAYYIIAILPITAPELAETSDGGAPLPSGGVPYPYFADPEADMQAYYYSVNDVLNATPPELFAPTIDQLDALIQSMKITP